MLLHDFSPQNAALFGHHLLSGSLTPSDQDKSGGLGLNLMPSDFGSNNISNMLPPSSQMKQHPFYAQGSSPDESSPIKSSDDPRPSSPVEAGSNAPKEESMDVKPSLESFRSQESKSGASNDGSTKGSEQNTPDKANVDSSKSNADSDVDMATRAESLAIEKEKSTSSPSSAAADSPTPADTPTESRRTSGESEKRSLPEDSGREAASAAGSASNSPQKRQRVAV